MSSKALIIGGIIFVLVILIGSYFLIAGGDRQVPTVKLLSYTVNDKERPKIEAKTTSANLGNMKVNEEKKASFTIKNTGQKTLQLTNIKSSCSCTVGQLVINGKASEEFGMHAGSDYVGEIAPENDAILNVTYRPFVMPVYGPVEREVYVNTNDPENPRLIFKVNTIVK